MNDTIRIGVGCTTTQSRKHTFALWVKQFTRHTKNLPEGIDVKLHTQMFYPLKHKSIAEVKNLCLDALADCDYVFLFDDDCFPVHDDWWKPFIEAHLRTGNHHFLFLLDDARSNQIGYGRKKLKDIDGLSVFRNAQGCCIFLTKAAAALRFDEQFTGYGFEHEDFSLQIYKAGLNPSGVFLSVPGIENYIYSLDVMGAKPYASQLGGDFDLRLGRMKSAISRGAMRLLLTQNRKRFNEKHKVNVL